MKTPQEKLPVTLRKSNLAVMTNMTDIEPQPEKKEAVLLISDCDYGLWNFGTVRENYSEALLCERLQKLAKEVDAMLIREKCSQLSIVNLGSHLYSRFYSNDSARWEYVKTYSQNIMDIATMINYKILGPLLIPCNCSRFVYTDYLYSQYLKQSMVKDLENCANKFINQYFRTWQRPEYNFHIDNIDGVMGTFKIFNCEVGVFHGNGVTPKTIKNRNFPFSSHYLLTGWNPSEDHYYSGNMEIIANGRVHQGASWDIKGVNDRKEPHQKLLVFGEHGGLLDIHHLKVA